jgi:hypothetical protein
MRERWAKPGAKEEQSRRMKEICSTVEHRQKLSVGHKKHFENPQNRYVKLMSNPHRKQVKCIQTDQVFESIAEASKILGVSVVKIRDSANKKRPSRGLAFEWVSNG